MSTESIEHTSKRGRKAKTPAPTVEAPGAAAAGESTTAIAPIAYATQLIPLDRIRRSLGNPRTTIPPLDELAADIARRGVLQPILVRPSPFGDRDGFELVFGECRYRASKLAGVETIPAMVRDLTDQEVLEIQLTENGKRNDIAPLEEADGFRRLRDEFKLTPEQIALRVTKSVDVVKRRLRLCEVIDQVRNALIENRIALRTAEQLALMPASAQAKAVDEIDHEHRYDDGDGEPGTDGPISVAAAARVLHGFTLLLADAPFDRGDAALVPAAGACTVCPKRTGAQTDLFGGAEPKKERCTDADCWREKADAIWQIKTKAAARDGVAVMPEPEAKKLLATHDGRPMHGARFVDLTQEEFLDGKYQTYKKILGKDAPPITLARDESGHIRELVARADVEKVLRANGSGGSSTRGSMQADAAERKRRAEEKLKTTVGDRVLAALVTAAEKASLTDALVLAIVQGMIARAWNDTVKRVASRRAVEIPKGYGTAPKALATAADQLRGGELRGLLVEMAIAPYMGAHSDDRIGVAKNALAVLKVDAKKIEAAVRAELKEAKAAKAKPGAKKSKPKKAAGADARTKVRKCRVCGCTEDNACVRPDGGTCSWIEKDLCNACEGEVE